MLNFTEKTVKMMKQRLKFKGVGPIG